MRKKILICIQSFQHGGIPKALENWLLLMDRSRYEINLFCAMQEGTYKGFFASHWFLLPQNAMMWYFCVNYRELCGRRKYMALAVKAVRKVMQKIGCDPFEFLLRRIAAKISGMRYDVVVSYAEGWITRMVSYVATPRRLAWIHIDYRRYLVYADNPDEADIYKKFSGIVSPSRYSASTFAARYPHLADRVVSIPNLLAEESVKNAAETSAVTDPRFMRSGFTIISVGRVCAEKRFYEIPRIAARLKSSGMRFIWYVVGDGAPVEVALLRSRIQEYQVEDCVIHLGAKDNPYPYLAGSDLLVALSISETFSYVINEAKILGVPIVSTDFGTAPEVLDPAYSIVLPLDKIHEGIARMMSRQVYSSCKKALEGWHYDNKSCLEQIQNLIDAHD